MENPQLGLPTAALVVPLLSRSHIRIEVNKLQSTATKWVTALMKEGLVLNVSGAQIK